MNAVDLGAGALWPLASTGFIFGTVALLFFRKFSDLDLLRRSWKRLLARFLELRLFMDDPVLILRSQRDLLLENIRMLRAIRRPLLLFLLPAAVTVLLLDACFARAALRLRHPAVVTVQLTNSTWDRLSGVQLSAPPGIEIETAGVRVPSQGQVSWRILPVANTSAALTIKDDAHSIRKNIAAGPGIRVLSARRYGSTEGFLLHWSELPFSDSTLAWVQVDYPRAVILGTSWILWFLGFSFVGASLGLLL